MSQHNKALVLSGGGARGAYQVGVLTAVAQICRELGIQRPFSIYTGISAGAINASYLAAGAHDFSETVKNLADMWSHLDANQVFHTDALNMGKIGLGWLEELSFGALTGNSPGRSLLNTAPLKQLIEKNMQFEKIEQNIKDGHLRALAVTAMDYKTSIGVSFIQGASELSSWKKARHHSERTLIKSEHIMASSAIPMLFPPIQVGNRFFGDGCVRNQSPCGPAIYLGAEKLFVIGVRRQKTYDDYNEVADGDIKAPSVARVVNALLNSIMLDGVELDLERLGNINRFVQSSPEAQKAGFKRIDFAYVSPTIDIGKIAAEKSNKLPRIIRYLLKGLGTAEDAAEIISYLLFEPSFCRHQIEVGFADGMQNREQIEYFLKD